MNRFNSLAKVCVLLVVAVSSTSRGTAEELTIEGPVPTRIDYKRVSAQGSSGIELKAGGSYVIPKIDPEDFEILAYEIRLDVLVSGCGWTMGNFKFATSDIQMGFFPGDNSMIASTPPYTIYGHTIGGITKKEWVITSSNLMPYHSRLQGDGTMGIYFLLTAGGGTASPHSGGGAALLRWGYPSVKMRLRRINPLAVAPVLDAAIDSSDVSFSSFRSDDASGRIHPSFFEGGPPLPKDIHSRFPIDWQVDGRKIFRGRFYGFPEYQYRVMKSPDFKNPVVIATIEGSGKSEEVTVDASAYDEDKCFFWIEEDRVPSNAK